MTPEECVFYVRTAVADGPNAWAQGWREATVDHLRRLAAIEAAIDEQKLREIAETLDLFDRLLVKLAAAQEKEYVPGREMQDDLLALAKALGG